tara:strand:+ start:1170 stop:1358 length:189 start_codon:yes stop_codon:yes gene_type:complete
MGLPRFAKSLLNIGAINHSCEVRYAGSLLTVIEIYAIMIWCFFMMADGRGGAHGNSKTMDAD